MRYAKSVFLTLATKGVVLPIGVLSSVLTARYLGPEGRGILAVLLVLQGFALQFGTFGFNASVTYFISRERSLAGRIVGLSLLVAGTAGIVVGLSLYFVRLLSPEILLGTIDPGYLDVFLLSIPFVLLPQFVQNVLIAQGRIAAFNGIDLFMRAFQLAVFALILIVMGLSTFEIVVGIVIVSFITAAISVRLVVGDATSPLPPDWHLLGRMMKYGIRTYVASFFMFLVLRVNLLLINTLLDEEAAGVYSITVQIADLAYLTPMTFGMLLFPRVSAGNPADAGLSARAFRVTFLLMSVISIGILLVGEPLIHVLYGEAFLGAVKPLFWLLPGIMTLALVMILNNDLAGRGLPPVVIIAPAVALIVNILLNLILIPEFGLSGSSMASSAAHTVMFFILFAAFGRIAPVSLKELLTFSWSDFRFTRETPSERPVSS